MLATLALAFSAGSALLFSQTLPVPPAAGLPPVAGEFSIGAEPLLDKYVAAQGALEGDLNALLAIPAEQRDFDNTVKAFENAIARFDDRVRPLAFLSNVSPDERVREASRLVSEDWSQYYSSLLSRKELHQAVSDAAKRSGTLSGEEKTLLEGVQGSFEENGVHLSAAARKQLLSLRERLATLEAEFHSNVADDETRLELERHELEGLPQMYIDRLKRTDDGKYVVTMDYPDYKPFMRLAENGDARRRLELKFNARSSQNTPLLEEALRLRDEAAKLLGHDSYAHMALAGNRMAGTPERVWTFLHGIWQGLRVKADEELKELLEFKKRGDPSAQRIESWEKDYYADKLQKSRFELDNEQVRQYLPMDRVVAGTMEVYERLLGVKFTEAPSPGAWHKDVRLFEITDADSGRRVGHFYLDLFPREGKSRHYEALELIKGRELEDGGYQEPVAAMVANFEPATAEQPSLLLHDEAETFFHEFGHIMHETLTKARFAWHSGFSVADDFAEAPSQMLENFVWEREILDLISGHWQDPSKKLPQELFEKMLAARSFNRGLIYARQVAFAMIDLLYHQAVPAHATILFNQLMPIIGLVPFPPESRFEASFGHLMPDYAAGYYGYLWAEVYSDDMFSRFKKEGLLNPVVGRSYRKEILEHGGARPEGDSVDAFLGRESNSDAFMAKLGVK